MNLPELIPDRVADWVQDGQDALYDGQTIFKYMNGAGEVYLSYAFQNLWVRQFRNDENVDITVELYDMGCSADAFGIFARNLTGEEAGIGQGSEYRSGYLLFWQDRYFITIFTSQESTSSRQAVFELGRQIAAMIPVRGDIPDLVALLPADQMLERSLRYFHLYTDLNQHYFLADENILALGPETEAVLAQYDTEADPLFLLIVRYPDVPSSVQAYRSYLNEFIPEVHPDGIVQLEDGYWTAASNDGQLLLAVYDAPTREVAVATIAAAEHHIWTVTRPGGQPENTGDP